MFVFCGLLMNVSRVLKDDFHGAPLLFFIMPLEPQKEKREKNYKGNVHCSFRLKDRTMWPRSSIKLDSPEFDTRMAGVRYSMARALRFSRNCYSFPP